MGGQIVTWVPPLPNYDGEPKLFAKNLSPQIEYVVETSTDLIGWHVSTTEPERSPDKQSLFLLDFEATGNNLPHRFYRLKAIDRTLP